jgi:hypothetical protein
MIVLDLPRPPSVNELYRNVPGKGRVKTRHIRNGSKRLAGCWSRNVRSRCQVSTGLQF